MPKGYWIIRIDIKDGCEARYDEYRALAKPALEPYDAKFLVRAGQTSCMEGEARTRNIVVEFKSYEDAMACYMSDAYQKALEIRKQVATSDLVIVEGA